MVTVDSAPNRNAQFEEILCAQSKFKTHFRSICVRWRNGEGVPPSEQPTTRRTDREMSGGGRNARPPEHQGVSDRSAMTKIFRQGEIEALGLSNGGGFYQRRRVRSLSPSREQNKQTSQWPAEWQSSLTLWHGRMIRTNVRITRNNKIIWKFFRVQNTAL